jgi:hypothetical protein
VPGPTGAELETEHLRVAIDGGVTSVVHVPTGRELLRGDRSHDAFTPVYELSPGAERGPMGLNRKGEDVVRTAGRVTEAGPVTAGPVFVRTTLAYELPGTRWCELELALHRHAPRLDASLRLHRESVADPENLYLSLPFAGEVLLDRAGIGIRPRVDQIPGTLTDYYSVDHGFLAGDTAVAMPDANLVQLGPLAFGERLLAGDPRLEADPAHPYAWLSNNFWETNFDAETGGFFEFRFSVIAGADLRTLRTAHDGLFCFRLRRDA